MSKTVFTISEQKQNVINFIKKHKDMLCLYASYMNITDEYIYNLEKSNTKEFISLASDIQLKFGQHFYIFSDNCDEKHRMITIWLPAVLSKIASDNAIKEFCGSCYDFEAAIESLNFSWYNMTPKRWEAFEAIFDFYDKPKKTAKKTAKKAKKIVKPEEVKLSDSARLKDDIVF